jgi:uncharacterized membrane protein YoaK (UPF0700 family)
MLPTAARSLTLRHGLLLLLACAAGAIDAISYLGLGRVFTANMTGNTVLLGLALIQAEHQEALRVSLALVGFLGGGALRAWVVEQGPAAGRRPRTVTVALALEWGVLWVFAVGWLSTGGEAATFAARGPLIVLSALAMGVQCAAARRLEVSGSATTYITGIVTTLAAWPRVLFNRDSRNNQGSEPYGPTLLTRAAISSSPWIVSPDFPLGIQIPRRHGLGRRHLRDRCEVLQGFHTSHGGFRSLHLEVLVEKLLVSLMLMKILGCEHEGDDRDFGVKLDLH